MKVSLNTIKQYIDFELPPVDELVARINSQLGGVENVTDLASKYKDVVIVRVVTCEKHPNADKLSVCMVDDGGVVKDIERDEHGYVRVVCGAPNVHADMYAPWLPPRATVPTTYGTSEPFVLDARDLRGIKSNGMLAAADELDLGSDHAGIIEIDPNEWKPSKTEIKAGVSFAEVYGLDDTIIDIENKMFTHRPDCFGQLGVAREIAGILGHKFTSPAWYHDTPQFHPATGLELQIVNNAGEKVPRFMAVAIQNVTIKQSPLWLRIELVRLGGKPINNIVDVTNYVMLLTAQPTHAYDYDKLRGHMLGARLAEDGEKTTLLNGKTYELTSDDIVIVDGEGIVGLGGVMGGGNSEVSDSTKNIVLECASFDMYTVRKTSMRHGLFTDAVTRFNKGQSPLQNDHIMNLLMMSVNDVAAGEQATSVFDESGDTPEAVEVKVSARFINDRLGLELNDANIIELLQNVEIEVFNTEEHDAPLEVQAPFWRTDIELAEDVVEEVGRLYGYDKLPRELPKRSIAPAPENSMFKLKEHIRSVLSRAGANEVLTYSFVHENVLTKSGQDATQAYQIGNALSPDLQYYRLSLTPSLLDKVHMNIKAGHDEFALFEIGKAHRKGDVDGNGLPREFSRLAFVYAAKKSTGAAYYTAKRYLELLTPDCQYTPLDEFTVEHEIFAQLVATFEPTRSAVIMSDERFVGVVGEYRQSVAAGFKLPKFAAGFELFLSHLEQDVTNGYRPLSRFPSISQDISLKTANDVSYAALLDVISEVLGTSEGEVATVMSPVGIYQSEDDPSTKTTTFHIEFTNHEKTLTDADIAPLMERIAIEANKKLAAVRV